MKKILKLSLLASALMYGLNACNSGTSSGSTSSPSTTTNAANYAVAMTPSQQLYASIDGSKWSKVTTSGITDHVSGVNCSTQVCALSGDNGEFLLSNDLKTWTKPANYSLAESLNEVTAFNNTVVAVGNNGSIVTAIIANGMAKSVVTKAITQNNLTSVAYNSNGEFVAVGTNGAIFTSTDGTTWIASTSSFTAKLNKVISIDNKFIAVGDNGTILTSANGLDWAQVQANITQNLYKVKFINGFYYIVGSDGAMYRTSDITDVSSIQKISLPVISGNNGYDVKNIAKTAQGLVAYIEASDGGNHNIVLKSTDGITWQAYQVEQAAAKNLKWSLTDFFSDVTNICNTVVSDANQAVQTITTVVNTITTVVNDINNVISTVNTIPSIDA